MNETFKDCDSCASKPGSPILCSGCLHNRTVISNLKAALNAKIIEINRLNTLIKKMKSLLEE